MVIYNVQQKRPAEGLFLFEVSMNIYLNLKPNNYEGESDLLTLDLPSHCIDDIMRLVRPIAEQKETSDYKVLKDVIKEAAFTISQKNYERKNRKNKKR